MFVVCSVQASARCDWCILSHGIVVLVILSIPVFFLIVSWFITRVSYLRTISYLLILNYSSLHLLINYVLNLFCYLGLLVENAIIACDTSVSGGVTHGRRGSNNVFQMLSLIHLWHELVELVIAIGFYLLQEVVHFQSLPIARDLPSCEDILGMLWQTHVITMKLMLKGIFLP